MNLVSDRLGRVTSTGIVYAVLLVSLVVGAILTASAGRNFFSTGNISAILTGTSILGFVAIGQTLVILVGSLDLSVPYVISLTSLIAAGTMDGEPGNITSGVLVALAVAAAIGLVNGVLVAYLDVHGFIATLGIGLVVAGYLATNYEGSFGSAPRDFRLVGATQIGPVPLSTLIMLGCAALAIVTLRRTRLGHHLYAVGGNRDIARMSGLHTAGPVVAAHVLCSLLAALAGLLLLARLSVGSPTIGSQGDYDLMSIAAVVLGGTVLAGARATSSARWPASGSSRSWTSRSPKFRVGDDDRPTSTATARRPRRRACRPRPRRDGRDFPSPWSCPRQTTWLSVLDRASRRAASQRRRSFERRRAAVQLASCVDGNGEHDHEAPDVVLEERVDLHDTHDVALIRFAGRTARSRSRRWVSTSSSWRRVRPVDGCRS